MITIPAITVNGTVTIDKTLIPSDAAMIVLSPAAMEWTIYQSGDELPES